MFQIFGFTISVFQIVVTVFGVGLLIFIHELGHFLMAKKFGMKVEKFAFGFGPEIVGFTKGGTRYQICAIPLGGMVKLPGEDVNDATGSPDDFISQPWHRRLAIAVFGPFMNYVLAVILFTVVIYFWGLTRPSSLSVIGEVIEGYPAHAAGIRAGDTITSVNGVRVKAWEEMAVIIHKHPEKKIGIGLVRDEQAMTIDIVPRKDPVTGYGLVGITPKTEIEHLSLAGSVYLSCKMAVFQSVFTLKYLGEKLVRWEKPDVAGPIGVVQILARAARTGVPQLLYILAVISVALGLFNLLPIPLVDGGHILLALIEGVIRRPINKKVVHVSNLVGFTIIISIFVLATYNDLARLGLDFSKLLPK
ncbi:MAG: site-2 protease family protein [Endomicrobiales bacterium]|nr:site-2 protease family protein [Endomicrobiales bacterium]